MNESVSNTDVFSTEIPSLTQKHLDILREGSGLSIELIRERGYRTVLGAKQLADAGFAQSQQRPPGLLIPVNTVSGINKLFSYRPDFPRITRGKELKYELPRGTTARLDVPPRCIESIKDPSIELWITEGQKKADVLAMHGLCAVALLGVWNFKGKNKFGGVTLLADFDEIALGRVVNIAFDSDVTTQPQVRAALDRLTVHMQRRGATVNSVYLPGGPKGEKVGVDDFLLSHTVDELVALVQLPPPVAKAAAPAVELLDDAPATLSKPLGIVDGYAYAATWLWTRTTITESLDKKSGNVVRHDPPIVSQERQLVIVRSDGKVFEPNNMDSLSIRVDLSDIPQEDKLWRTKGVKQYRDGNRPDYSNVFARTALVYRKFIDFAQSFASQDQMYELSACFSLATWLQDGFTVIGYPWPNGERGSGKTQWGVCWANTSYLGIVVLASGSFAALRDLADYGATMLFDDAENLGDTKRTDPEKRALLLAGNRRGAKVPIKVPSPEGRGWETKWINAFCPRGFTAISLPDPVLGSRSIRLPLVRTSDARKANVDPGDLKRWPCDQRQLQDDLWATGLALLPEVVEVWAELDEETELIGREFEPWRPILAVARLFERHGVSGLEERMRATMHAYQKEKAEIDTGDRATQVIKAILFQYAGDQVTDVSAISDISDVFSEGSALLKIEPSKLKTIIDSLGDEEGFETEWASPKSIGWQLKSLRFNKGRNPSSKKRERYWTISAGAFFGLCQAYGVVKSSSRNSESQSSDQDISETNVRNGQNVRNVRPSSEDEVRV